MKLNMKMIAIAAAMVATGAANAAFTTSGQGSTTGNSTLAVLAWNAQNGSYYVRDTGYFLNNFLPNGGALITGSNEAPVVFDKTPEAGLTITSSNSAANSGAGSTLHGFGTDALFGTWVGGQAPGANLRYTVIAADKLSGASDATDTFRQIFAINSTSTFNTPSFGTIVNQSGNANGILLQGTAAQIAAASKSGILSANSLGAANGAFINQTGKTTALGANASLFYAAQDYSLGGNAADPAFLQQFGNSAFSAVVNLSTAGDLTYTLAAAPVSAVPVPAAAWLMGSGLMAIGGVIRRRKAAAKA